MKNIHVLPTDKPSRIIKGQDNVFILLDTYAPNWFEINLKTTKQNIYITSDEEIKEGDWFYNIISLKPEPFKACENGDLYVNCSRYSHNRIDCKKIILTTDQDLIKDGVQAIDDEFLEWFVKNPSCECIEIIEQYRKCCRNTDGKNENCIEPINCEGWLNNEYEKPYKTNCEERFNGYKIIIPKEEHKQERMYSEEEVELIANEMVNWAIDNIGNPFPQSGKKFDEVIAKYKKQ